MDPRKTYTASATAAGHSERTSEAMNCKTDTFRTLRAAGEHEADERGIARRHTAKDAGNPPTTARAQRFPSIAAGIAPATTASMSTTSSNVSPVALPTGHADWPWVTLSMSAIVLLLAVAAFDSRSSNRGMA